MDSILFFREQLHYTEYGLYAVFVERKGNQSVSISFFNNRIHLDMIHLFFSFGYDVFLCSGEKRVRLEWNLITIVVCFDFFVKYFWKFSIYHVEFIEVIFPHVQYKSFIRS